MTEAELATADGEHTSAPELTPSGRLAARPLERGDVVGRYVVLARVGVGGMGEVYAAYDPELDRKIAIKLLLPGHGDALSTSGHGRLLREAQAMAKLRHPNVIAVHDVGTHDVRVFVAMEFVDGGTLGEWMSEGSDGKGKPHPWASVVTRFLAAGEGLAAAHAAGLIHRDFKPANVLVGRDGSVRVADFGLARGTELDSLAALASDSSLGESAAAPVDPGSSVDDATLPAASSQLSRSLGNEPGRAINSLSMRMTMTGATLGTPAYMAPEQYGHASIDARADQFSFCVALWEALYGERPFVGDNLHALMFAIAQANIREPQAGGGVPASIRRALVRGLANDPQVRWPDMKALMTQLRFDPRQRRRKLGLLGLGAGLLGALAWGLATRPAPAAHEDACTGAAAALGDALTPERRAAVAARFSELEQSWAHDVGDGLLPRLDAWTLEWQAAWTDACAATSVRGEQSAELLDRRMLCLNRQRRGFVALVDGLISADEALARKADGVLAELGSIAACSDVEALLRITAMPDDKDAAAAIVAADAVISSAHGAFVGGRMSEAKQMLESQREAVTKLDYAPLSAAFEHVRGRLAMTLEDPAGGEQALERAFALALQGGDDRGAVKIARALALALEDQDRASEAARWLAIGAALVERLNDDEVRGDYAIATSQVLASLGDLAGAEAAAETAYELLARTRPNSAILGDALYLLGVVSYRANRHDQAIERLELARKAWASDIGPRHPRTAAALGLLGVTARATGEYAKAEVYFRESLDIKTKTYGEGHIQTTDPMTNLSVALSDQAKFDEGIALIQRVLTIRRAQDNPIEAHIGRTLINLAQMQRQAGRLDDALATIIEGEALVRGSLEKDHPDLATVFHIHGVIQLERGELDEAERNVRECLRIADLKWGADNAATFEIRTTAARIALARGHAREAESWLEGPSSAAGDDPKSIGEREFVVAKIHAALGRESEAIAAARRAVANYEQAGPGSANMLAETRAWLREHE